MKRKLYYYIFTFSIILNFVLIAISALMEYKGRVISYYLEKRGYCEVPSASRIDYWAVDGWTNCLQKMNLSCDAVFFGNSITRGSDFKKSYPELNIINIGYSGNNLVDMKHRIPMLKSVNPKKVFIMAGTNDLVYLSIDEYKKRYIELLDSLHSNLPYAQIYIESVLPTNHKMSNYAPNEKVVLANKMIESLANEKGYTFIDLYSLYSINGELPKELTKDGVHLYPSSYEVWSKEIKKYLYD